MGIYTAPVDAIMPRELFEPFGLLSLSGGSIAPADLAATCRRGGSRPAAQRIAPSLSFGSRYSVWHSAWGSYREL